MVLNKGSLPVSLVFKNNFAEHARNDIFGAFLRSRCKVSIDANGSTVHSADVWEKIIIF